MKNRIIAALIAACAFSSLNVPSAFASSLITYKLSGVTGTVSDVYNPPPLTDTLTGTFTYDTAPFGLGTTAIDIVVSGPYPDLSPHVFTISHPDNFATAISGDQPYNGTYQLWLAINFSEPLGNTPDPVSAIFLSTDGLGFLEIDNVTGMAVPVSNTPIGSTAPLLATGLTLLAFVEYWRKKRNGTPLRAV